MKWIIKKWKRWRLQRKLLKFLRKHGLMEELKRRLESDDIVE